MLRALGTWFRVPEDSLLLVHQVILTRVMLFVAGIVCVCGNFLTGEEMIAFHNYFYCVGCSGTYFIDHCHIFKSHIVLKHAARRGFF